jgi:two-component system phosphate regulon response regulator PhoB
LTDETVVIDGLKLDPVAHRISAGDTRLELGPTEFRLLHFLMTHPERVHSRTQLLDQVWGDHVFVEERTVDVHIRRLRLSLEVSGHDRLIQTVRGSGYRLAATA